jgi:DNA-directed RNA polymerase specialized sigma24 family protein
MEDIAPARRRLEFANDEANPMDQRREAAASVTRAQVANSEWMALHEKELKRLNKALKGATPEQRNAIMEIRKNILRSAIAKKNELTDIGLGVD